MHEVGNLAPVSLPEIMEVASDEDVLIEDESSDSNESAEEGDPLGLGTEAPRLDRPPEGGGVLSPMEIVLFLLDWMCTHKATDTCVEDLWTVVKMMYYYHYIIEYHA